MKLTILGTSSMMPTKERNHSAYFLNYNGEGILFDCGEGTQNQIKKADIKPTKISKILISHWHGDHVFGLPGLIETLANLEYSKILHVYGPKGTKKNIETLNKLFGFRKKIKCVIKEIKNEGCFVENNDYKIEAYYLNHSIETIGFRFVEKDKLRIDLAEAKKYNIPEGPKLGQLQKGKSIKIDKKTINPSDVTLKIKGKIFSYIPDTGMTKNCMKIAKNANVLLCESTYSCKEINLSKKYKHLSSCDAANIAKKSMAERLILTHFSQRYKNPKDLLKDTKKIFKNTSCAEDFMEINL